ncbi:hypothetical protein CBOM_01072 [Ceraceosorus bombacis]|uniref:Uncharacterized protein n=1 Tax=Ceraceosorus bombacis TaxID=401625 RepID=A0A0P1BAT3_9BASI|nr:hypothetical protein CBOM_01072 [Ceraceosorus bombacis]
MDRADLVRGVGMLSTAHSFPTLTGALLVHVSRTTPTLIHEQVKDVHEEGYSSTRTSISFAPVHDSKAFAFAARRKSPRERFVQSSRPRIVIDRTANLLCPQSDLPPSYDVARGPEGDTASPPATIAHQQALDRIPMRMDHVEAGLNNLRAEHHETLDANRRALNASRKALDALVSTGGQRIAQLDQRNVTIDCIVLLNWYRSSSPALIYDYAIALLVALTVLISVWQCLAWLANKITRALAKFDLVPDASRL